MYGGTGDGGNMYQNNMYANMMGQQQGQQGMGGMSGQQLGNQQMLSAQAGQQMGQMPNQQMQQMASQQGQQQASLLMGQQQPNNAMMAGMAGMSGMMGGMAGNQTAIATAGQSSTATPAGGAGAGVQGTNASMMGQQAMNPALMAQQGANPMMANWQAMAASNPQALATMQAYMQQYAMRMAAFQRMAAAASAGGMGAMGTPGAMGAMGAMTGMGAMGGMAGPMGAMAGPMGMGMAGPMGMMAGQMGGMGAQQMGGARAGGQDAPENMRFWKTRICNKWKDGHCPYGDTCKYAHGEHDLRSPGGDGAKGGGGGGGGGNRSGNKVEVADKRTMIELMRKTRMCEEFVKNGSCRYGDKCTFAHSQNELRQAPNVKEALAQQQQQGAQGAPKDSTMHKTRLCERFMKTNTCPYGDKCTFAHGHHELRQRIAGGAANSAGLQRQQQQQQRPGQAQGQQPGQPGAAGAAGAVGMPAVGVKREREEDAGAADAGPEADAVKRQNTGAEGQGAAQGGQDDNAQDHAQEQEQEQHIDGNDGGDWGWDGQQGDDGDGGGAQEHPSYEGDGYGDADGAGADGDGGSGEAAAAASGEGAGAAAAAAGGAAAGEGCGEGGCVLCARMLKAGRDKMLAAVQQMASPTTQKLGAMILGYGMPRFELLWHKLSFAQLQSMLSKADLSVSDRIELLKTVLFHTHASEEERERLGVQKYISQGLPPQVADFVAMAIDFKEGSAQMTEYFAALEVCKLLYGVTDDEFFNVSSTMASLMVNM